MTVLVIGGTGFVGSHVVDALLAAGRDVRVLGPHPELFRAPRPGVDYRFGRLEIGANLTAAMDGVDAVVDAVSTAVPASAAESPSTTITASVGSATWLGELCLRHGVRNLVYLSSGGTVYGRGDGASPHREDDPLAPIGTYGAAKAASELSLTALLANSPVRLVCLRIANAYGERQNPDRPQGIVAVALDRLRNGTTLTLFGDTVRDYVHVADVASAAVLAVSAQIEGPYNVGAGTGTATTELLARMEAVTGLELRREARSLRAFDVPHSVLAVDHVRGAGWSPSIGLDEGLARTWAWYRDVVR